MREIPTCFTFILERKRRKISYLTVVRGVKERDRSAVITCESGKISWSWIRIFFIHIFFNERNSLKNFLYQAAEPGKFRISCFFSSSAGDLWSSQRDQPRSLRCFNNNSLDHFNLGYLGSQFPGDFRQLKVCFSSSSPSPFTSYSSPSLHSY